MPDKWEYPWYAAWDLAFHCIPLALVDPDFAKRQLVLMAREWYMHPNGQLPAYEWSFGDVNPPVHAWAAWRVYKIDAKQQGHGRPRFLESIFHKLLLNFTWWVNKKDDEGKQRLSGRISRSGQHQRLRPQQAAADRRSHRPVRRDSLDGILLSEMLKIALELAKENPVYQDTASKIFRALPAHRQRHDR